MRVLPLFSAVLLASPFAIAQEQGQPNPNPNPKHEQHDALKALAGHWTFTMKMEAMPGVMDEPSECKGSERAELICNGLWLKSTMNSTWEGKPWQGVWLCGYDPSAGNYTGIMVSSDDGECGAHSMDGQYDAKTRTWTWTGTTPMGEMRTTMTMPDADTTVETCYLKGDDAEKQFMQITRKRSKSPVAVEASAGKTEGLGAEQQRLLADVGTWQATVKCSMNGQEMPAEQGTELIVPICNGRWTWSNFDGRMGGAPFEGHALVGYDPQAKEYIAFWFDSMSATCARTTGTFDEESNSYTFQGECKDPQGKTTQIEEKLTLEGSDKRVLQMQFQCEGQESTMEITYLRQAKR